MSAVRTDHLHEILLRSVYTAKRQFCVRSTVLFVCLAEFSSFAFYGIQSVVDIFPL